MVLTPPITQNQHLVEQSVNSLMTWSMAFVVLVCGNSVYKSVINVMNKVNTVADYTFTGRLQSDYS